MDKSEKPPASQNTDFSQETAFTIMVPENAFTIMVPKTGFTITVPETGRRISVLNCLYQGIRDPSVKGVWLHHAGLALGWDGEIGPVPKLSGARLRARGKRSCPPAD